VIKKYKSYWLSHDFGSMHVVIGVSTPFCISDFAIPENPLPNKQLHKSISGIV
jgi:hypothetical protein